MEQDKWVCIGDVSRVLVNTPLIIDAFQKSLNSIAKVIDDQDKDPDEATTLRRICYAAGALAASVNMLHGMGVIGEADRKRLIDDLSRELGIYGVHHS